MIALVEGAERQKTPNEIALNIVLAGLTIIFLFAVVTLQPFAVYSGAPQTVFVLISLLVCLIPTTIGGLLSAIALAGMDRLVQHNALATSGRALEAAGDVNTYFHQPANCHRIHGSITKHLLVAAREHKSQDSITSVDSGPHWLRISGRSTEDDTGTIGNSPTTSARNHIK